MTSWRDDLENLSPNTFQLFGFTTYLGSYLPTLCLSSTHASTYLTLILMHTSLSFSPIHILRYTSLFISIYLKHPTLLMYLSSVNVSTQDFFFEVIFLSLRRYLGTGTSHSAVHDLLLFMSNFIILFSKPIGDMTCAGFLSVNNRLFHHRLLIELCEQFYHCLTP